MDDIDSDQFALFLEVQRGLPRQGPGDAASTLRALKLCDELPAEPNVLDVGCGPGMQTVTIAEAIDGNITAVDTCEEYLDQLRGSLAEKRLSDRVTVRVADMNALDLPEASFDLIWSEGAAYIMGIPNALKSWRPLLKDGGYLAFTELVWLVNDPPAEVSDFFAEGYPAMTSVAAVKELIAENGYDLIDEFTLPDFAWWENYYTPLEAKFPALKRKYQSNDDALGIIAISETEIEMRRRFGETYGYQFYIARKRGD